MKKVLLILAISLCFFMTGCRKYTTYTEVSLSEFQTKLDNKDSFVIVMGSATCSACAEYKVTMEEVIKDKQVEIFYIDLNKLSQEEHAKVYSKYVIKSTPTTIFIQDGVETSTYNRIVGTAGYSAIVNSLKNYGYLGD